MSDYKPSAPFTVPLYLLIPVSKTVKGSTKNTYPESGDLIYCSFKTFGGTEVTTNGVLSVENTAIIETWYRPDIKANCRFKTVDGLTYEVLGTPENINQRNQYLKFKIKAVKGGS